MAGITTITVVHGEETGLTVADKFVKDNGDGPMAMARLVELFGGLSGKAQGARVSVRVGEGTSTAATATITCTQASASDPDTVTIGDVVLTAVAAAPSTDEFLIGSNDTELADNLAAAITAQVTLSQHVTATAATGVVTLTAKTAGSIGNLIKLETDNAPAFALSATSLGGATETAVQASVDYSLGVA